MMLSVLGTVCHIMRSPQPNTWNEGIAGANGIQDYFCGRERATAYQRHVWWNVGQVRPTELVGTDVYESLMGPLPLKWRQSPYYPATLFFCHHRLIQQVQQLVSVGQTRWSVKLQLWVCFLFGVDGQETISTSLRLKIERLVLCWRW